MMSHPSLLGIALYCAWTLLLLGGIAILRGTLTISRVKLANSFAVNGADVSRFSGRLCRAHANCYESLPAFLGVMLVAQLVERGDITDPLVLWFVAARVAQSTTHLISTSVRAVEVRFAFFLIQFGILWWWVIRLILDLIH